MPMNRQEYLQYQRDYYYRNKNRAYTGKNWEENKFVCECGKRLKHRWCLNLHRKTKIHLTRMALKRGRETGKLNINLNLYRMISKVCYVKQFDIRQNKINYFTQ